MRSLDPQPGETWLDLCCGTGDLALELARSVRPGGRVVGLDAASAPLDVARRRQSLQPWLAVDWLQGDALQTGLASVGADGVVMPSGGKVSECDEAPQEAMGGPR